MIKFNYDKEKAIAAMLYIINKQGGSWDKYSLLKILYFAEKNHLATYGRPITGDTFNALRHGPVPSHSYNLIRYSPDKYFTLEEDNVITSTVSADLDMLSDSDIECLDKSIKDYQKLSFGSLKAKSHDAAYNWTVENIGLNEIIPYLEIAKCGGANSEMLKYIGLISENQNCSFDAPNNW